MQRNTACLRVHAGQQDNRTTRLNISGRAPSAAAADLDAAKQDARDKQRGTVQSHGAAVACTVHRGLVPSLDHCCRLTVVVRGLPRRGSSCRPVLASPLARADRHIHCCLKIQTARDSSNRLHGPMPRLPQSQSPPWDLRDTLPCFEMFARSTTRAHTGGRATIVSCLTTAVSCTPNSSSTGRPAVCCDGDLLLNALRLYVDGMMCSGY